MRVIAGDARRTVLYAPDGQNTRPTADRIKENLFNILAPHIPGAVFLDLFCGSGAIGIEALSRGASAAFFVDNSRNAIAATNANLERSNLTGRANVLTMSAQRAISQLETDGNVFDIIFLDPPYGSGIIGQVLDDLEAIIANDGIIVAEISSDNPHIASGYLELYDERDYGSSRLLFYTRRLMN